MQFSLIAVIPLIVLLIAYIYFDPFKVIRSYKDYSNPFVIPNRDYISTTMFLKNNKRFKYNSFIFGSSRVLAYKPESWLRHLSEKDKPFMFDASMESIYGIYTKIKFLDSLNVPMKNVLIIICRDETFNHSENHEGHLYIKHPSVSGESAMTFQSQFFKAYLSPKFLFNFYYYVFSGKYESFMSGYIEHRKMAYDTITNQLRIIDQETEITENPAKYYRKRSQLFYTRKAEQVDSVQRINSKQLFMLQEIKRILEKHLTNYKIVISPLYEQVKFSGPDQNILNTIFRKNLYDFSGKNQFTELITNYYETSHYRPNVGDSIFEIIYR